MRLPHPLAVILLQLVTGEPLSRDQRLALAVWVLRLVRATGPGSAALLAAPFADATPPE